MLEPTPAEIEKLYRQGIPVIDAKRIITIQNLKEAIDNVDPGNGFEIKRILAKILELL